MRSIAAVAVVAAFAPGAAWAADGYPRLVEKSGQMCLQDLGANGAIVETCQREEAATALDLGVRRALDVRRDGVDAAEAMSWASVKYSWSAAFKWSAIVSSAAGGYLLIDSTSGDGGNSSAAGWYLLGNAGISLVVALLIDGSAEDDVAEARRILAR